MLASHGASTRPSLELLSNSPLCGHVFSGLSLSPGYRAHGLTRRQVGMYCDGIQLSRRQTPPVSPPWGGEHSEVARAYSPQLEASRR